MYHFANINLCDFQAYCDYIVMAPQRTCTSCSGKFGPTMFVDTDVQICRFCQLREKIADELNAAHRKIDALTTKLESLQEFATLNVGVPSAQETTTMSTAIPVHTVPVPVPTPAATLDVAENNNDSTLTPPQDNFQLVRNNVHPSTSTRKVIPTTCQNRFKILAIDEEEETEEVRLVGDSMVRGQLTEFCARAPRTRKRFCIPGGGVDDIVAAVEEVSRLAPASTTYVIHVGSNDVQRTRSEELLCKYRRLIRSFKEKSNRILISGIVPRIDVENRFYNIATSTNRRLAKLCREEDIGFVDTWDHFYYDKSLFSGDGVHLNEVGAARLGRLLNDAVKDFRSKNGVNQTPDRVV